MKKFVLFFIATIFLGLITTAQNVNIPDSNFKAYLVSNISINLNADGEIQKSEANSYSGILMINNLGIIDLTGIEEFTSLTSLYCYNNSITNLDLSANTALVSLDCEFNQLTSLVTNNPLLSSIYCSNNLLGSIDISHDGALTSLFCSDNLLSNVVLSNPLLTTFYAYNNSLNQISFGACPALQSITLTNNLVTSIDVSANTDLRYLYVSENFISNLNLKNAPNLTVLNCGFNQLYNIDVSSNLQLINLVCNHNQLSHIDISPNTSLTGLKCNNNNLTSLNAQNGNNANFGFSDDIFDATNNPNLTCIRVDDTTFMNANWNSGKDPGASFAIYCSPCVVNIPDLNFKAALLANAAINTNGNGEIECSEAEAYTGILFVNNLNISDVTGIESFTHITNFSCNTNQLTSLDLRGNASLLYLNCSFNQINNLKLPAGTNLQEVICNSNQLHLLDLSACHNINFLEINDNHFDYINTTNCSLLNYFYCNNNNLVDVDVSSNHSLLQFNCSFNKLANLNVQNGNNPNMSFFQALGNPYLSCIQVDDTLWATANWTGNADAAASFHLICSACIVNIPDANFKSILLSNTAINTNGNTEIECVEAAAFTGTIDIGQGFTPVVSDLTGIEKFTSLTYLNCSLNNLTSLNVTSNTSLTTLFCYNNYLTNIDLSANISLEDLNLAANLLTNVSLSTNTALRRVHLADNLLTSIDVSNNTAITELILRDNLLTSIDVSANTALTGLSLYNNKLTTLDVTANHALNWYLYCEHNNLYKLDMRNGMNSSLPNFSAYGNPLLSCIMVDDTAWANANWSVYVDPSSSFEINCPTCVVNIPDVNFKNALLADPLINTNGNSEIECAEALAFTGTINVASANISDLTGIAGFANIEGLNCNNNQLTQLDLSANTSLKNINCNYNLISSLILPQDTSLHSLNCSYNLLTTLDLYNATGLRTLACESNLLTDLSVFQCSNLTKLSCFNNQLGSLDLSENSQLRLLQCYNNQLSSLVVFGAINLVSVECQNNLLNYLDVSNCTLMTSLDCNGNQINTLQLTPSIDSLYCSNNLLSSLDISANTALTAIDCSSNQLTSLSVQNGNNTSFIFFNATSNPSLFCIQVDNVSYMNSNWNTGKDFNASFSIDCNCILPSPAGSITGAAFVAACANQLGIAYSVDTIAHASGYTWTFPPLAVIIGKADTNAVHVDYNAYSSSGYVTVAGTNQCGTGPAASLAVNFKSIPEVQICGATVDSATQKTIISWQRASESYVNGYVVYREHSGAYQAIDTVPNTPPSAYLDSGSTPELGSEKYKIAVLDSCGNVGDSSSLFQHQTMYLYGYVGAGSIAKIYWTDYIGNPDPNRYYNVMRDTSGNGSFEILAANLPKTTVSYTDVSSGGFNNCRYYIDMFSDINCDPTMRTMASRSTSRSNIKNKGTLPDSLTFFTGISAMEIPQNEFSIYPNPAKDHITIVLPTAALNYSIAIFDLLGKEVLNAASFIDNRESAVQLPLNGLRRGLYIVKVKDAKNEFIRKLAVE